jgi:hypothetical protein
MATATTHATIGGKSHAQYRSARFVFVDAADRCACAARPIAAVFGCLLRVFLLVNVNLWLECGDYLFREEPNSAI